MRQQQQTTVTDALRLNDNLKSEEQPLFLRETWMKWFKAFSSQDSWRYNANEPPDLAIIR